MLFQEHTVCVTPKWWNTCNIQAETRFDHGSLRGPPRFHPPKAYAGPICGSRRLQFHVHLWIQSILLGFLNDEKKQTDLFVLKTNMPGMFFVGLSWSLSSPVVFFCCVFVCHCFRLGSFTTQTKHTEKNGWFFPRPKHTDPRWSPFVDLGHSKKRWVVKSVAWRHPLFGGEKRILSHEVTEVAPC